MLADYAFVDDVITAKEARLIRKYCMDRVEKSLVEGRKEVESRKSKNTFIKSDENLPKVIKDAITKILKVYFHVCQEIYNFPIETVEPIQFVEYGKGDYYDAMQDIDLLISDNPESPELAPLLEIRNRLLEKNVR